MKKLLVFQISALIIISGSLGGMLYFTDIYDDVQSTIVEILCLSCIKLQPVTSRDFIFKTANGVPHPNFVVNTLKTKGPILIQYGYEGCESCDEMIENVMIPFFNIEFLKDEEGVKQSFETEVNVGNLSFYYIYINIEDDNIPTSRKESYQIYDKDHITGFPMFTIITIEYEHGGDVKPYYTTLYGEFEGEDNWEGAKQVFTELLEFSIESYDRNIAGFK
jgi:hypothetical protein